MQKKSKTGLLSGSSQRNDSDGDTLSSPASLNLNDDGTGNPSGDENAFSDDGNSSGWYRRLQWTWRRGECFGNSNDDGTGNSSGRVIFHRLDESRSILEQCRELHTHSLVCYSEPSDVHCNPAAFGSNWKTLPWSKFMLHQLKKKLGEVDGCMYTKYCSVCMAAIATLVKKCKRTACSMRNSQICFFLYYHLRTISRKFLYVSIYRPCGGSLPKVLKIWL